jgi:hypothetical protein
MDSSFILQQKLGLLSLLGLYDIGFSNELEYRALNIK